MDTSPTIATLVVRVPLPESDARSRVKVVFPNSESALKQSLFYKQTTEFLGEPSEFFVSAHRDQNNYTLIVHFQMEEEDRDDGAALSRMEVRIEPGLGVDIRKASEEVWQRLFHAKPLLRNGTRPRLVKAAISSGGPDIVVGRERSLRRLMLESAEFRLPILVGALSVVTLTLALFFGFLPTTQVPNAWWVVSQLVLPAVVATGLAGLSTRGQLISWSIE